MHWLTVFLSLCLLQYSLFLLLLLGSCFVAYIVDYQVRAFSRGKCVGSSSDLVWLNLGIALIRLRNRLGIGILSVVSNHWVL